MFAPSGSLMTTAWQNSSRDARSHITTDAPVAHKLIMRLASSTRYFLNCRLQTMMMILTDTDSRIRLFKVQIQAQKKHQLNKNTLHITKSYTDTAELR